MSLSVQRPAVSSPGDPSGISVRTFFEEQLSLSAVAFVPKNYETSGDPKKILGEEAEKKVLVKSRLAAAVSLVVQTAEGCRASGSISASSLISALGSTSAVSSASISGSTGRDSWIHSEGHGRTTEHPA